MDSHGALRPTFELHIPGVNGPAVAERIAAALRGQDGLPPLPFRTSSTSAETRGAQFLIWIPDGKRKLWSPWLHVDVEDSVEAPDGSDACHVRGRFSPAPGLWTGVMLALLASVTLALGGVFFAWSQWLVGEPVTGLWLAAVAALVGLGVFASSRVGQSRARYQMEILSGAVERGAALR